MFLPGCGTADWPKATPHLVILVHARGKCSNAMPFVPVPNAAMVEIRYLLDGQQIENTLYFESGAAITQPSLLALVGAVFDWWQTNLQPLLPLALQLAEISATDLTSATGPQASLVPAVDELGAVNSPQLPNNVSLAVSFRTALRGRSFRGRNFYPALWEAGVDENTVQPTIITAIHSAYTALIGDTGVSDAGFDWVVVSRFSGVDSAGKPIPRITGVATIITTVVIVDPTIDSMRRRLPGRGR
jgi:hypothetical protein